MRPFVLSRDTFHILVALAGRNRHGYSIMHEVAERTSGEIRLSPSTLYSAVKRLPEEGLIGERAERPDPDHHDERRRYYRLTRRGRAVAMEETRRLERLLADARWAWRRARPGAARRRWCFSSRRRLAAFLPTLPATRVDQPIALRHEWLVAENHQGGAVEPSWIWGSGELSTN